MKKKVLSLLLAVVMTFSLAVTANAAEETAQDLDGDIVILHTNDVHGAISGYAKVAALKDAYEARGAYVLLMDAGDFIQGDPTVSTSEGATAVELMKRHIARTMTDAVVSDIGGFGGLFAPDLGGMQEPVLVSGLEAVKGWAWRAVDTARYRFSHFSWSYGCELEALVGQPYTADAKLSEAERYVTEALLVSPYIREARVRDKRFEGATLHMQVALSTVYGKETIYV